MVIGELVLENTINSNGCTSVIIQHIIFYKLDNVEFQFVCTCTDKYNNNYSGEVGYGFKFPHMIFEQPYFLNLEKDQYHLQSNMKNVRNKTK